MGDICTLLHEATVISLIVNTDAIETWRFQHSYISKAIIKNQNSMSDQRTYKYVYPSHCTASSRFRMVPRTISAFKLSANFETNWDSIGSC